jgi:hypothetical protein
MEPLQSHAHVFPYRAITWDDESDGGEDGKPALAPIVPIIVHGPQRSLRLQGLIDSGADCSLFPHAIMARIGIDKDDCVETDCVGAVGGGLQLVYEPGIEIEIPDLGHRMPVAANFSGLPGSLALLGRLDFFTTFRVTIDESSATFSLQASAPI